MSDDPEKQPEVGKLLRQSAVFGVAALLTAGDAVKAAAGKVKTRLKDFAAEAQKAAEEKE